MLPVILLTGFLGAGKTTLLQNLLRQAKERGLRATVIINEFGAVDIDGTLLRAQELEALASVAGGCACCSGQDEFLSLLTELSLRPDRPDVVIVEASGLADPLLLLELMTGPELKSLVQPSSILTVVDAAAWNRVVAASGELVFRQVGLADILVVNKADLVSSEAVSALESKLKQLNPAAEVLASVQGQINADILWERLNRSRQMPGVASSSSASHHAHTWFCPLPHPIVEQDLNAVAASLGPEIWRAKGFIRLRGKSGLWLAQFTTGNSQLDLAPVHLPFGMDEPELGLVFIGASINGPELMKLINGHRLLAYF